MIADNLSEIQIEQFVQVFERFDVDNSGTLSLDELISVMRLLGKEITSRHLQRVLSTFDDDNDGHLNLIEFLLLMAKLCEAEGKKLLLRGAFEVLPQRGEEANADLILEADFVRSMQTMGHPLTDAEMQLMLNQAREDEPDEVPEGYLSIGHFIAQMTWRVDEMADEEMGLMA